MIISMGREKHFNFHTQRNITLKSISIKHVLGKTIDQALGS